MDLLSQKGRVDSPCPEIITRDDNGCRVSASQLLKKRNTKTAFRMACVCAVDLKSAFIGLHDTANCQKHFEETTWSWRSSCLFVYIPSVFSFSYFSSTPRALRHLQKGLKDYDALARRCRSLLKTHSLKKRGTGCVDSVIYSSYDGVFQNDIQPPGAYKGSSFY